MLSELTSGNLLVFSIISVSYLEIAWYCHGTIIRYAIPDRSNHD